ncbi:hypothetical protein DFJ73DRAFT_956149 [Zopfochytrium polystomum]|nr:hypothetical protein DFJ73DRAFT_956149 [Zopfochytrium polystomum]
MSASASPQTGVKLPSATDAGQPKVAEKSFSKPAVNIIFFKSSTVALAVPEGGRDFLRSADEGMTWEPAKLLDPLYPIKLVGMHDVDLSRAFFFTDNDIYVTTDRLESKLDKIPTPSHYNELGAQILDHHPTEKEYLVFVGGPRGCPVPSQCYTEAYITFDSGRTWLNDGKPIETWATKCLWGWDTGFTDKETDLPKDSVICASYKFKNGNIGMDQIGMIGRNDNPLQLVLITNKGKDRRVLIDQVDSLLFVAVQDNSGNLRVRVSTNGKTFTDAKFPPNMKLEKNAFTLLESNSGGVYLDVAQSQMFLREYGALFKSNSNGTFYSRILAHTNRNERGVVDFDKMKGIPGILLANEVTNVKEMMIGGIKKVQTKISFDDGAHWSLIKAPAKDSDGNTIQCTGDCSLNLYNKYSEYGYGRASPHTSRAAAGIMLAVGSVGTSLAGYNDCNTYLTKDAGLSWTEVHRDAHKWAVGDHGGLIVLVNDEKATDVLNWSSDYGVTWNPFVFSNQAVRVLTVTTEPASTSLKFIITGTRPKSTDRTIETVLISIDFSAVLPRACDKPKGGKDLVEWSPVGDGGKDRCFLGQEIGFWRKKDDAHCYIGREFEEDFGTLDPCPCTEKDFECDYNFFLDPSTGKCQLYGADPEQPTSCKAGDTYKGHSGYRKIAISKCKGGVDLTTPIDRQCSGSGGPSTGTGNVKVTSSFFRHKLADYFYFNQTRTIMMRDEAGRVWKSDDTGQTWSQPDMLKSVEVTRMLQDQHHAEVRAYFISDDPVLFYTDDAGRTIKKTDLPSRPNRLGVDALVLHAEEPSYLIFVGDSGCGSTALGSCHAETHVSTDLGHSWTKVMSYNQRCMFARDKHFTAPSKDTLFCQVFDVTSGDQRSMAIKSTKRKLVRSTNLGKSWSTVLEDTVGIALSYEYMVAATLPPNESQLHLFVSTDGEKWVKGSFENDEQIPDYGYTLLDSSSGSIFLQVFSSRRIGAEYGALYRSISNDGTKFKVSLEKVNQDAKGYTDYEKLLGVPAIAIANEVINAEKVDAGVAKKIRTKMTFDDGVSWVDLKPPATDSQGNSYNCNSDCHLNLHHFTERTDSNDLFSSASAVGFMMGVGNVGEYLTQYNDGDTYITKDGGRTWREVAKDAHLYEFGNRGGVILLANNEVATDAVRYSLDHGETFAELRLSDALGGGGGKMRVTNIITEPHGSASSFVVFGVLSGGASAGEVAAVFLDFAGVWGGNECKMDGSNPAASDFEAWNPAAASSVDGCMFGEKTEFFRRKSDRLCKAPETFEQPQRASTACACGEADFECEEGYVRDGRTSKCVAGSGHKAAAPVCVNGLLRSSTGYEKSRRTRCQGGLKLDEPPEEFCTNKLSWVTWLFVVLAAVGIPAGLSFFMVNSKRGGRIRLTVDSDGLFASEPTTVSERIGRGLRTAGVVATELLEAALATGRRWYDAARNRLLVSSGYAPVRTSLDDAIDNDASLLDLNDEEG